jgi:hypothetical protein
VEQGGQVRQSQAIGQPGSTDRQAGVRSEQSANMLWMMSKETGAYLKNGNPDLLGIEVFAKLSFLFD